jgi:hypothetical protein
MPQENASLLCCAPLEEISGLGLKVINRTAVLIPTQNRSKHVPDVSRARLRFVLRV